MTTLTNRIPIRPRILIAEDDTYLVKILKRFMEDEMLAVDTASNGQEAIELLHKQKYRLALLDINMPLKNGFDVLREINALKEPPPAIMFSNFDQPESKDEAIALGAKDYFVKEKVDIDDLRRVVRTYIKGDIFSYNNPGVPPKPKPDYPTSEK
jgi:DNA-binding response OmpR family regulator